MKERATGKVQLKKCAVEITKGVSEYSGKYEMEDTKYSTGKYFINCVKLTFLLRYCFSSYSNVL